MICGLSVYVNFVRLHMAMIWSKWCYFWCFIAITCYAESTEEAHSGENFEIISSFQKTVEEMKIELKELHKVNTEFKEEIKNLKLEKENRQLQFETKMLEANSELIKLIKEQRNIYEDNSKCNLFLSNCMAETSRANEKYQENSNTQLIITAVDKMFKEQQLNHWMTYENKVKNYDINKALLEVSSYWVNTPIASVLISLGADVKVTDKVGNTPLIKAAQCQLYYDDINVGYEMSKLLLQHGANINAQNKEGVTALMNIVSCSKVNSNVIELVNLLLENNADVNLGKGKSTVLMIATEKGYLEIVKILLDHPKVDVNLGRHDNTTALIIAAEKGQSEIGNLLLKYGAHPDVTNTYGNNALIMACQNKNVQIAMILVGVTQNLNIQNNQGKTAVMYAALTGNQQLVQKLIDLGADIYIKDGQGKTIMDMIGPQTSWDYNQGRGMLYFINKFTTTPIPSATIPH